ncbi:MAG TPA: GNAT family N-acetyltransferase [Armatimonadetes bacterium]|nr:GNAT family N-acetyltransferase [Armatimonadota bacterium]
MEGRWLFTPECLREMNGTSTTDEPRALRAEEMDELLALVNRIFRAGEGRMQECFPTLFCPENRRHLRVLQVEGKIVSHIGAVARDLVIHGCRVGVGCVGAVCTHEDYRQRGYATTLLEDVIATLRAEGVDVLFISGRRGLYRRHGAASVGRVEVFTLTPAEAPLSTAQAAGALLKPDQWPELARLYRQEPVRFHRPREDWEKFGAQGPVHPYLRRERRFYSVTEGGRLRAYFVLMVSKGEGQRRAEVSEYAGCRHALLAAVPPLLAELSLAELHWRVPAHDEELCGLLWAQGRQSVPQPTAGTVSVIHFPRLMARLGPLFAERAGEQVATRLIAEEREGTWRLALDGEEIRLTHWPDLARLVFGPAPGEEEVLLSLPACEGEKSKLSQVLRTIFPLPRPEYGLNYV